MGELERCRVEGVWERNDGMGVGGVGKGYIREDLECSYYMKNFDVGYVFLWLLVVKKLLVIIDKNFLMLVFCWCYFDWLGEMKYLMVLKNLCD